MTRTWGHVMTAVNATNNAVGPARFVHLLKALEPDPNSQDTPTCTAGHRQTLAAAEDELGMVLLANHQPANLYPIPWIVRMYCG